MEQVALRQANPASYCQVASPRHTVVVLSVLAVGVLWTYILADQMRVSLNPHRIRFSLSVIVLEWLTFALVVEGVRRSGTPIVTVLGDRWQSFLQVLRDIGIAAAFWIISIFLLAIFGVLLHISKSGRDIRFMYPRGRIELGLWVALSITAGVCEEAIFRGYLQLQFMALTKSAPAGILISAVAFGACHAYQGFRRALLLGLYGTGFGILAHWRKNVRPGMIVHSWHDLVAGLLPTILRRYS